jgi:uncharacterized protein (DUF433 family)
MLVGWVYQGRMATQTAGIEEELLDEPHVAGRRVSVLQLRDRVEEVGEAPQAVAEAYDLDVAAVYQALAYYHTHTEEMERHRERREREAEAVREKIAAERPDSVTPP